jgi:hypothetical protein
LRRRVCAHAQHARGAAGPRAAGRTSACANSLIAAVAVMNQRATTTVTNLEIRVLF